MPRRHGESVYQRGRRGGRAGQWVAVADLGWHDGKRDRREFTGPTKQKALQRRDAFLHKRAGGFTPPKGAALYVSDWLSHWLHHVAAAKVEATTWHRCYRPAIERHAVPFFSRIPLAELTEEDVEAWHAWLARPSRGLSSSTIGIVHRVTGAALKEAVVRGKMPRNPCSNVPPPKVRRAEITPPSPAEVQQILGRCRDWPNGARWVLALGTGLRQGEALALQWRDVRLDGSSPSLTVRHSRARVNREWVVKEPKSAKSRRVVPLPGVVVAALRKHRGAQAVTSLDGLVFTTAQGRPVHGEADRRDWLALLEDLRLPRYRVHDCRHAYATLLLRQGQDVRVVQELLGHSSAAVTQNVYQHVTDELRARAVAAVDEALGAWE